MRSGEKQTTINEVRPPLASAAIECVSIFNEKIKIRSSPLTQIWCDGGGRGGGNARFTFSNFNFPLTGLQLSTAFLLLSAGESFVFRVVLFWKTAAQIKPRTSTLKRLELRCEQGENEGGRLVSLFSANWLKIVISEADELVSLHRRTGTESARLCRAIRFTKTVCCSLMQPTNVQTTMRTWALAATIFSEACVETKLTGWPWRTHQNICNSFWFYHLP